MKIQQKIKNILKNEEFHIALLVIGAFGLIAWYKGGGRFDTTVGIFGALILLVIVGIIAGVVAMFVRHYLDEKTKIKNSYIKFFITRLTWVGIIALVFFLFIKVL
tara:strand:+ start:240 stop:554 length:315 start_codon:yes stop_codon:yes gene_type:complete